MLITPICPKMMAKPNPMSSNTAKRLRPAKPCINPMLSNSEKFISKTPGTRAWTCATALTRLVVVGKQCDAAEPIPKQGFNLVDLDEARAVHRQRRDRCATLAGSLQHLDDARMFGRRGSHRTSGEHRTERQIVRLGGARSEDEATVFCTELCLKQPSYPVNLGSCSLSLLMDATRVCCRTRQPRSKPVSELRAKGRVGVVVEVEPHRT
jgi:hypothetical protein